MPVIAHRLPLTAAALLFCGTPLCAVPAPSPNNAAGNDPPVSKLIEQLGDADYRIRERAQADLAKLGFKAYDAIEGASVHEDLEIAARARYLLALIRTQWTTQSDPPEVRELLEDYGFRGQDDRYSRIRALARLRGGAGIPALCRVVRFEKSELLSKHAAIEILDWEPADSEGRARLAEALREHLSETRRPAAKWLLTYLALRDGEQSAQEAWSDLVESERAVLQTSPQKSSPHIVATLLYHLAEIQANRGLSELADETARRARQLSPGNHPSQLFVHLEVAGALQRRGQFRWAEAEYRGIIEAGVPEFAVVSQRTLAEMWHDQGNDMAAAEALEAAIQVIQSARPQNPGIQVAGEGIKRVRARMNYFLACHWAEQGDRAKQIAYLDEALKDDPGEIDTLIACWRLPDQPEEFRSKIGQLIDRAASELRQEIGHPPEDANACNQFAWLVGNTKGDSDEALNYSLKSIELSAENGAFYDTLAHVYYARGDFENAVKAQTRAVELEPHSGLILKQLKVFRAALEDQQSRQRQAKQARGENATPAVSKPAAPQPSSS